MSKLRFVFGASGSGKTTTIYKELLERAKQNPEQNFLVIVPDQYTMQSQWDLAHMSEDGGILGIDVLSFGRLTHRILQEVGIPELPVLDDTGKCLVLQRVAGSISNELPLLGSKLHKQGYIHEVKSVISEFMQYGISEEDLEEMINGASSKVALCTKLKDLKTIYSAFKEYLDGHYITREEKLDILREVMPKSGILPGSVVVFDGFTGFTPIQVKVIEDIINLADETIVSLALGEETEIKNINSEYNLFYLSKKTYDQLSVIANKYQIPVEECRVKNCSVRHKEIEHLEKNLFRSKAGKYESSEAITLLQMGTIPEEVHQIGIEICRLLREDSSLQYRNIAIVTGDVESYAPYVEREFSRIGIPYFIDRTGGIKLNPLVELIRSTIEVYTENFSVDSVFRYMRTGMTEFDSDMVDKLELYVRETGIKGKKKWSQVFARRTRQMDPKDESQLRELNEIREAFINKITLFEAKNKATATFYINSLYDYLLGMEAAEKLNEYAEGFNTSNDKLREKEYSQIYKKVMELFEQINSLMGEDEVSLKEFYEILDAGFGEIRIGNIPQSVDRINVGDIERSRVPSIRILFFLGANDGNIPKNSDKGGILSDIDRDILKESGKELSPTPREAMYTQRLYLYLNMTKPIEKLYISWADLDESGKSLRPAYICDTIIKLYPGIKVRNPESMPVSEQIVNPKEGLRYLSDSLRRYVENGKSKDVYTLYEAYGDEDRAELRNKLKDASFISYSPEKLDEITSQKLYCNETDSDNEGAVLSGDVSKLETYAQCPFKFFLRYGLGLKETQEFEVSNMDVGSIYHKVIELFSRKLASEKKSWKDFDEDYARESVHQLLTEYTDTYGAAIFQNSERNKSLVYRIEKALLISILSIQRQIKKGDFEPRRFEDKFESSIALKDGENGRKRKLKLRGKIDRVDVYEKGSDVFLRIVDYKSSQKDIELDKVYDGQQLQLPVYLRQEIENYKNKTGEDRNVIPASMLYYHVDNPIVKSESGDSKEKIEGEIAKEFIMNGLTLNDNSVLMGTDKDLAQADTSSMVIAASTTSNGNIRSSTKILNSDDMKTIMDYALYKSKAEASEILDGNIPVTPVSPKGSEKSTCAYCSFKASCPYDRKIPGYMNRKNTCKGRADEIIALMREKQNED